MCRETLPQPCVVHVCREQHLQTVCLPLPHPKTPLLSLPHPNRRNISFRPDILASRHELNSSPRTRLRSVASDASRDPMGRALTHLGTTSANLKR